MSDEHISSYSRMLGFIVETSSEGRARIACVLDDRHMNTRGVCHGGVVSGLMDMAAGVAVRSQLDNPERLISTVSLTINYERPGQHGDSLVADARVRSGRRIVSCAIEVRTEAGVCLASGVATLAVR